MISYEICGRQSAALAGISPSFVILPLLNIILPLLHAHISPSLEEFKGPDQAAHPWALMLRASALTQHLAGCRVSKLN
jgi:hypothetical protein